MSETHITPEMLDHATKKRMLASQSVAENALRLLSEDAIVRADRFITFGDSEAIRVDAVELEALRLERLRNQKVLDTLNHKKQVDHKAIAEFHGSLAVRNLHKGEFRTRDGQEYGTVLNKSMGQTTGRRIERKWDRPQKPAKCSGCGRKHRASVGCR